jgi:peroxiredoxin
VKGVYEEIRRLGGEVLAVSFTGPRQVAAYLERYPLPFPAVSDPERTAYRAFALEQTSWGRMLRPAVLARYLLLMVRGWMPWKPKEGDDLLQLGGDFVLDQARRVVHAYRSAEPTDRPPARQLLEAVLWASGGCQPPGGPLGG